MSPASRQLDGLGHYTGCRLEKEKALGPCELGHCCVTNRRVHARGMDEGASPGTAGPCGPTPPAMLGR